MNTAIPRVLENKTIVIKVGGSTLGEGDSTIPDIAALWKRGIKPVVVHGGGKVITCLLYTSPSPRDTERSRMPSSA